MQVLACDVGGTNVRFGIFSSGMKYLDFDEIYECNKFRSFEDAVDTYLKNKAEKPSLCIVGAAGDTDQFSQEVIATNTPWKVSLPKLKDKFPNFISAKLVNDFALQAWALSRMNENQYQILFDPSKTQTVDLSCGNILMVGPGTGLGSCSILQDAETRKQTVHTAESGHMDVPNLYWNNPKDNKDNYNILNSIRKFCEAQGKEMVAEHLVSGTGISNIYHALQDRKIPQKRISAMEVENMAKYGDAVALRTFDFFFSYLGAVTGSIAVVEKANKIFFNGGVMASEWIVNRMQNTPFFKERAIHRAGMTPFMKNVLFIVSKERNMATLGCKAYAEKMLREFDPAIYLVTTQNRPPILELTKQTALSMV